MTILAEIYGDPILFGSGPGFVNRTQSDPGFVNPIRSGFCQSDPIRSGPGFVNAHFRPINGTVESAHFIQVSILIKSLRIISPKNPLEIDKNYLLPSKSQTFSQFFCVAHS